MIPPTCAREQLLVVSRFYHEFTTMFLGGVSLYQRSTGQRTPHFPSRLAQAAIYTVHERALVGMYMHARADRGGSLL